LARHRAREGLAHPRRPHEPALRHPHRGPRPVHPGRHADHDQLRSTGRRGGVVQQQVRPHRADGHRRQLPGVARRLPRAGVQLVRRVGGHQDARDRRVQPRDPRRRRPRDRAPAHAPGPRPLRACGAAPRRAHRAPRRRRRAPRRVGERAAYGPHHHRRPRLRAGAGVAHPGDRPVLRSLLRRPGLGLQRRGGGPVVLRPPLRRPDMFYGHLKCTGGVEARPMGLVQGHFFL
jgi:hypothetical protein